MTRINTVDLVWNTGVTFGVAIVSGVIAWTVKKIAHCYFGDENNFKRLFASISALSTGIAVGCGLASRATVMTFSLDKRFRGFHSLHTLAIFVFSGLAAMMLYEKKPDKAMIFCSMGTCFVITYLTGIDQVGSKILPFAGVVGTLAGVYPYGKC